MEDLASDGMRLTLGFWTDSHRSDFKDTSSEVRLALVAALRAHGVPLPEPDLWRIQPAHGAEWQVALDPEAMAPKERVGRQASRTTAS